MKHILVEILRELITIRRHLEVITKHEFNADIELSRRVEGDK